MRITTVSSGLTTTQALISARRCFLRGSLARERDPKSDDKAAAGHGCGAEELPPRDRHRVHADLPSTCSMARPAAFTSPDAAALIAARTRL